MNQTKKRLSIINLAISITDIETIQLQILKLGLLKSDQKIQEIIAMLQAENYAQAQMLITTYMETSLEEVHQRSTQEDTSVPTEEESSIIEEFDLFTEENKTSKESVREITDLHAFIEPIEKPKEISTEQINYDTLLNIDANEILPDNIELNISDTSKDTFFDSSINDNSLQNVPKDTFFDNIQKDTTEKTSKEELSIPEEDPQLTLSDTTQESASEYTAISYIDQKFQNLYTQYPPIEKNEDTFSSVQAWIKKISNEGYSDKEIEVIIQHIEKLVPNHKAEAAELLLLTASTKSKYAQFLLARALYKGEILVKNISEAFTLMHTLANHDNYPEAMCDLGQFYEYGIGTDKDKNQAKLLYKNAMELGIKRASAHYERINSKKTKGLFSSLLK